MLSGCGQVKTAQFAAIPDVPADAHPAPVGFSGLEVRLPTGQQIGLIGADAGIGCLWPFHQADRDLLRGAVNNSDIKDVFQDTLRAQGYDITGNPGFHFADDFEDELLRSEYKVGARITAVEIFACYDEPSLAARIVRQRHGFRGQFYMAVDWFVYDALRRHVTYRTSSEGYAHRRETNSEGLSLMLNEAFEMATHNFGADPDFRALIFSGIKPPPAAPAPQGAARPRQFDPQELVILPALPVSHIPFQAGAATDRKIAVLVQAGAGHGSGFFITPQGHILTSAHVVGDALRVRIVTADKEQALIAEVLRKDKARDVALLKLEEVPSGFEIITLPLRLDWPAVSETVYTIGAPKTTRLQDSVRAGIISAHRRNFAFRGTRQNLLQADVNVQGGNSGGPLLDGNGNVAGLVHGGFVATAAALDQALNMFVPIDEALIALDIDAPAR